jgi:hypothetical protein
MTCNHEASRWWTASLFAAAVILLLFQPVRASAAVSMIFYCYDCF